MRKLTEEEKEAVWEIARMCYDDFRFDKIETEILGKIFKYIPGNKIYTQDWKIPIYDHDISIVLFDDEQTFLNDLISARLVIG